MSMLCSWRSKTQTLALRQLHDNKKKLFQMNLTAVIRDTVIELVRFFLRRGNLYFQDVHEVVSVCTYVWNHHKCDCRRCGLTWVHCIATQIL